MSQHNFTKETSKSNVPTEKKSYAELLANNRSRLSSVVTKTKVGFSNANPSGKKMKQNNTLIVVQPKTGKDSENFIKESVEKIF